MTDTGAIGARVQEARKRRGMTQADLARLSGMSISLIRKLEQGEYGGIRLETVHKLAVALAVQTSALAVGGDAPVPGRESAARWEPVRRALDGEPADEPDEAVTLDGVQAGAAGVDALYRDSRLAEMGTVLPRLLRDADALVAASVNGTLVAARAARSRVRLVAASLMIQAWQFETAWRTLTGAMDDANDMLGQVAVASQMCFALIRQGRLAQARDLAMRWADDTEPRITQATRDELAAWAGLLTWASAAAARDNMPEMAAEAIRLARMAAVGTNGDFLPAHAPWQPAGPTMVAVAQAENAVITGRPGTTLAIGAQLEHRGVARQYVRHRLDVANAHASLRHFPEAMGVLAQLRETSPEWLACQRYAGDVMAKIIQRRRVLTPEMREMADFLHLAV